MGGDCVQDQFLKASIRGRVILVWLCAPKELKELGMKRGLSVPL